MEKSKDLFLLMREEEVATSNFFPSKKELELTSKKFANKILKSGEIDKFEAFAQAERLTTSISNVRDVLKASLPRENQIAYGILVSPVNGRQMIQFSDDAIWCELQKAVKDREELLKVALKTDAPFYDSEGIEIPKVSVKYASDSLTVKY